MEIASGEALATHTADRGKVAPPGIFGGKGAKKNEVIYYLGGKEFIPPMKTKVTGVKMNQGDRLVIRSPGGGGYGDPFKRDAESVLRDVKMEYISAEFARKEYGVVIVKKDGKLYIDQERTARQRSLKG